MNVVFKKELAYEIDFEVSYNKRKYFTFGKTYSVENCSFEKSNDGLAEYVIKDDSGVLRKVRGNLDCEILIGDATCDYYVVEEKVPDIRSLYLESNHVFDNEMADLSITDFSNKDLTMLAGLSNQDHVSAMQENIVKMRDALNEMATALEGLKNG